MVCDERTERSPDRFRGGPGEAKTRLEESKSQVLAVGALGEIRGNLAVPLQSERTME